MNYTLDSKELQIQSLEAITGKKYQSTPFITNNLQDLTELENDTFFFGTIWLSTDCDEAIIENLGSEIMRQQKGSAMSILFQKITPQLNGVDKLNVKGQFVGHRIFLK